MNESMKMNRGITGLAIVSLMILPGCGILDFVKSKMGSSETPKHVSSETAPASISAVNDDSKVLMSIDGKPVITEKSFNEYYEQFISSNPQLQAMVQFMPNAKKEIFNGMANERLILAWGEKNHIHNDKDYTSQLDQAIRMIKTNLAAKRFEKDIIGPIEVSDKEMREYYEAHKDPELIVSPGGIKAEGKQFDSKEEAQELFNKIKENPNNFKADAGKGVKDFAPINKMSFDVDNAVKDKVLAVSDFPKALMVEDADKKYWVVVALKKEDGEYRSFDEVKDGLKKMIERNKTMQLYTEKIEELKKEYKVTEDTSVLEPSGMPVGLPAGMIPDISDDNSSKKSGGVKSL